MKWIVGAAIVLAIAIALQLGLLAFAMYALLAIIGLSRYLTQSWVNNVVAERKCNLEKAEIGDVATVIVQIRNKGMFPIPWVLAEDALPHNVEFHNPPNLEVEGERLRLNMIWRGKSVGMTYRMKCNRRGYYQIGPLVLETGDLFGLHRRYRVVTTPHFLLVYPQIIPLDGYEVASRRPIGEVKMTYRLFEDPTRIAGIRQYQAGDPLNRVHWGATARTGELHSKIYEPTTVAGATLLLDFHRDSFDVKQEPVRSELAITAAASIANALYLMGQQVGLISNGRDAVDRIRQEGWVGQKMNRQDALQSAGMQAASDRLAPVVVETERGPSQFMQILESLARLEMSDGLTISQTVLECQDRIPRDATVIAILARPTVETAIALGNLKTQGYAVSAIVNEYDEYDFAAAAGTLISNGIEVFQLNDAATISYVCRKIIFG